MANLSLTSLILSALVSFSYGSGYHPAIGGPWSRYTTTQPPNTGVNLPVTTAAPPPEVTLFPRPTSSGNNSPGFGSSNQNFGNGNQNNKVYIITDPATGEQFSISQDLFWQRFGDLFNRNPQMPSNTFDRSDETYNYNRGVPTFTQRENKRVRRMADSEEEDRQIDQLQDDYVNGPLYPAPESYEFVRSGFGVQDNSVPVQETPSDMFKKFFPDFKPNRQMIYMYTMSCPNCQGKKKPTTTSTSTTTEPTTTSTTEAPSSSTTTTTTEAEVELTTTTASEDSEVLTTEVTTDDADLNSPPAS